MFIVFFPDFPAVNWVIQFDCPEDADTYIHRAGRTARFVLVMLTDATNLPISFFPTLGIVLIKQQNPTKQKRSKKQKKYRRKKDEETTMFLQLFTAGLFSLTYADFDFLKSLCYRYEKGGQALLLLIPAETNMIKVSLVLFTF